MKELDDQELLDFIFLPEVLPEACEGEWFGQVTANRVCKYRCMGSIFMT